MQKWQPSVLLVCLQTFLFQKQRNQLQEHAYLPTSPVAKTFDIFLHKNLKIKIIYFLKCQNKLSFIDEGDFSRGLFNCWKDEDEGVLSICGAEDVGIVRTDNGVEIPGRKVGVDEETVGVDCL